jgi:hypothetical protein
VLLRRYNATDKVLIEWSTATEQAVSTVEKVSFVPQREAVVIRAARKEKL